MQFFAVRAKLAPLLPELADAFLQIIATKRLVLTTTDVERIGTTKVSSAEQLLFKYFEVRKGHEWRGAT